MKEADLREVIRETEFTLAELGLSDVHVRAMARVSEIDDPSVATANYFEQVALQLRTRSKSTYDTALDLLQRHIVGAAGRRISGIGVFDDEGQELYDLANAPNLDEAVSELRSLARELHDERLDPN